MIVFETPGLIDPRAFTTGGLSAKVNDNPIGRFGTGLKYAIAVLVRMGMEPTVWIGKDRYQFSKQPIEFRGKGFDLIVMKQKNWNWRKWRSFEMPFTTEYGKHWELWQVYRELEANTRDENGHTSLVDSIASHDPDKTYIEIDDPGFEEVYNKRHLIFLPKMEPMRVDQGLEMYQGESKHLYFRGMRVLDLQKPSMFTWNFTRDMDLTEDRSLRSEFMARTYVGEFVSCMEDLLLIDKLVRAKETWWESSADYTYCGRRVSEPFSRFMQGRPKDAIRSAISWADSNFPEPVERVDEFGFPWSVGNNAILNCKDRIIFQKPDFMTVEEWEPYAGKMVDIMNKDAE